MAVEVMWKCSSSFSKVFSRSQAVCSLFGAENKSIVRLVARSVWRRKSSSSLHSEKRNLLNDLINRIKVTGPLTVAAFMQEVLTNPSAGYYMKKDVFGASGDFITSPEISQVFGELVGVWFVYHWLQTGKPEVQLVELGPGRGTLSADILRVIGKFKDLEEKLSLHLVEVSPALSDIQARLLTGVESKVSDFDKDYPLSYRQGKTPSGIPVSWYQAVQDVSPGNTFFLAHEFFDALPIHQFKKTNKGWREVLVDIDQQSPSSLRFVLAPGPTIASESLVAKETSSQEMEVCPKGGAIMEHVGSIINRHGGCALIVDYGEMGSNRFSLRAFSKHKLHDVLDAPGTADMTANVNFAYLKQSLGEKAKSFGPVTQTSFLKEMGIDERMKVLMANASESQGEQLQSGYKMLLEDMGEKFKFFAVTQHGVNKPPGFSTS
ncbi:protein arginine methyltransferase NDUFAF7, mitochondrial-like [Actinia tenebrosa]|uniref:Protein arginine methyltransferase NDUFAF7 n=1 Tax=Actinia tenebrosa TaxID=6105 RepID=A0A6P8I044_ACTTE|nr:protein arginine methyltransferase NDUFAF7, mitochondrial-like [Actinia tenebrosa]